MSGTIVVATVAIVTGAHAALGTDNLTIFFDEFPATADLVEAVGVVDQDGRYSELLKGLEVEEILEYRDAFDGDGFLAFDSETDGVVGSLVLEAKEVFTSSALTVE